MVSAPSGYTVFRYIGPIGLPKYSLLPSRSVIGDFSFQIVPIFAKNRLLRSAAFCVFIMWVPLSLPQLLLLGKYNTLKKVITAYGTAEWILEPPMYSLTVHRNYF